MKTFKDNQDHQWTISLTLGKVRQIREKLGLDLLNPNHYLQILGSLTDRLLFCWMLVEYQAKERGIEDVDAFEELLYGENVATEAGIAFLEETEVFFQKLGQKAMATLALKSIESMRAGQIRLDEMIKTGQFSKLLDQAEAEIQKQLQSSAGSGL